MLPARKPVPAPLELFGTFSVKVFLGTHMTEELLSLTNVGTHYVIKNKYILLINADVIIPDVLLLFRCRLTGLNNCLVLGEVLCLTKQKM